MSSYVSNGEVHISIGSEEWNGYCDYLRTKLEGLEAQKKTIEEKIAEIHKILNPPPVELEVKAEPEKKKEEPEKAVTGKYLLPKDIAVKFKVTEESVLAACQTAKIPFHKVGDEYRFTPSDVEQVTSIASRKDVFVPVRPVKHSLTIDGGKTKKISSDIVYEKLGIGWYGAKKLRDAGLLTCEIDSSSNGRIGMYYEKEVNDLIEIAKEMGGIAKLIHDLPRK